MLVKTTIGDILEKTLLHPEGITIENNSICGKCSKCGECCTPYLPINQEELDEIQKYVKKNKIKSQKQMLVMQNRLTCPYYDGKKCMIYEVRPLICKEFYCYKKPDKEMAMKFTKGEQRYPVDMWAIAKDMDKLVGMYKSVEGGMKDDNN